MDSSFNLAIHALVCLSHSGRSLSSEALAENICTNPTRVRRVMAGLKKAGMVETREVLETVIIRQDVRCLYEAYRENLTEMERTVIRMRYGLFGTKEHTQREIAEKLGISRSYVSRIEKRAVGHMREAFYESAGKTL